MTLTVKFAYEEEVGEDGVLVGHPPYVYLNGTGVHPFPLCPESRHTSVTSGTTNPRTTGDVVTSGETVRDEWRRGLGTWAVEFQVQQRQYAS